jgi:CSLREA domain-containing protein
MRGIAAVLLSVLWLATAAATTMTVTTTDDENDTDGDCSLREAIRSVGFGTPIDACSPAGADTIHVPAGTYVLDLTGADEFAMTGDLDVWSAMTIEGDGAGLTIIDGNSTDRIFDLQAAAAVTIRDLTRTHGAAPGDFGGAVYGESNSALTLTDCAVTDSTSAGGAVYHFGGATGTLTIQRCAITGNESTGDGGGVYTHEADTIIEDSTIDDNGSAAMGGGIAAAGGSIAFTVDVDGSTISNNRASNAGGGIVASNFSTVNLTNSTLSGNTAGTQAGALIYTFADGVTMNNVTVTNNTVTAGDVGGILRGSGSGAVSMRNTIVAGNSAPMGSSPDCYGTMTSQGHNLIGSLGSGCSVTGDTTGNLSGAANLGPLANNGGATLTHKPGPTSNAVDAGDPSTPGSGGTSCAATDQRGLARPGGTQCDIGAVESDATPPTTTTSTSTTSTSTTSTSTTSVSTTSSSTTSTSSTSTTVTSTTTAPPVSTTTTTVTSTTFPTPPPPPTFTTTTIVVPPPLCINPGAIDGVVTFAKLGGTPGDEKLTFKGTVDLPGGALDPLTQGMQVLIEELGIPPVPVLRLTAATGPIPPGARGTGCGPKDGWKKTTYTNASGALPPDCAGASAHGLRLVKLKDRRAKGRGVGITVKMAGATVASPTGPVRVTLVFDADTATPCGVGSMSCTVKKAKAVCQ